MVSEITGGIRIQRQVSVYDPGECRSVNHAGLAWIKIEAALSQNALTTAGARKKPLTIVEIGNAEAINGAGGRGAAVDDPERTPRYRRPRPHSSVYVSRHLRIEGLIRINKVGNSMAAVRLKPAPIVK